MLIIRKLSPYLPDADKINILKLNKKFSNKINKKIYKEILNRKDKEFGIIQNKSTHKVHPLAITSIFIKHNTSF